MSTEYSQNYGLSSKTRRKKRVMHNIPYHNITMISLKSPSVWLKEIKKTFMLQTLLVANEYTCKYHFWQALFKLWWLISGLPLSQQGVPRTSHSSALCPYPQTLQKKKLFLINTPVDMIIIVLFKAATLIFMANICPKFFKKS